MNWMKVGLRFAVTTPNFERIRVIVPFALRNLRVESRNVQLLAFRNRVSPEACRVQTYRI